MGLLDQLLGAVMNQGGQQAPSSGGGLGGLIGAALGGGQSAQAGGGNLLGALLPVALSMLQGRGGQGAGGLGGLLQQFQAAGLGKQADSWVGTGANVPISAEQLMQALGRGRVAEIAGQAGVSEEQASTGLAAILPELVNQVTPQGQLPAADGFDDVLGGLRKQLGL